MLARTRRTTHAVRRAPHRKVVWAASLSQNQTVTSGSQFDVDLISGLRVAGVGLVGGTIVRTHIAVAVSNVDTDTGPALLWGTIIWEKGVIPPDPNSDLYVDWLMLRFLDPALSEGNIGRPENAITSALWGREYDVKSRRKLNEMNDSYFFSMHNLGSASQTVTVFARTAVMLP